MAEQKPERGPKQSMPRWVKVQGIFLVLFVLIVVGMFTGILGGGHG